MVSILSSSLPYNAQEKDVRNKETRKHQTFKRMMYNMTKLLKENFVWQPGYDSKDASPYLPLNNQKTIQTRALSLSVTARNS